MERNLKINRLKLISITGSVFLTIITIYLSISANEPKLIIGGRTTGTIDATGLSYVSVGVRNDPRFFGIRKDRETAKITYSYLRDNSSDQIIPMKNRNWIKTETQDNPISVSIPVGERRDLRLFLKKRNTDKYYVFNYRNLNQTNGLVSFSDPVKEFTLFIIDSIGREYRFELMVKNTKSDIQVRSAKTIRQRWEMLKEAFTLIGNAIKPKKF